METKKKKEFFSEQCEHKNQLLDEIEGCYVCTDCAKVLDPFFCELKVKKPQEDVSLEEKNTAVISEISHRLNIPTLNLKDEKNDLKSASKLYLEANKKNFSVTLKEMSAVSGFSQKQLGKGIKNTITVLDTSNLLEKYCKLLELNFQTYAVIKETIAKSEQTGHNPITIVASHIYEHLKKTKTKKISMKQICEVTGISSISIQRYLKSKK